MYILYSCILNGEGGTLESFSIGPCFALCRRSRDDFAGMVTLQPHLQKAVLGSMKHLKMSGEIEE